MASEAGTVAGVIRSVPAEGALLVAGAAGFERVPPRRDGGFTGWHQPLHVRDRAAARHAIRAQVEAGADVVVAPAYLTHRRALSPYGETRRAADWTRAAVEVAREAIEQAMESAGASEAPPRRVLLAGPMSPMVPGRFEPALDPGVLAEEDRARADLLVEAGVDLLLAEAMPSIDEARSAASAAVATGVAVWLGLRVAPSGAHLPSGDALEAAWAELAELPLGALLVTPSASHDATEVLQALARFAEVPLGVWWAGPPDAPEASTPLVERAGGWLDRGVRVLGIAAGASPERIATLRTAVDERIAALVERRRDEELAWLGAVAHAADRAPGGRALWLGGSALEELPAGFAWTVAAAEQATLPDRTFRLVIAVVADDPDAMSGIDRLARLLDDGGFLLVRSSPPLMAIADRLERVSLGPAGEETIGLFRLRR